MNIEITEQELKDLKGVRNLFGVNDKTMFSHKAFAILDNLVKKTSDIQHVSKCSCTNSSDAYLMADGAHCDDCDKLIK